MSTHLLEYYRIIWCTRVVTESFTNMCFWNPFTLRNMHWEPIQFDTIWNYNSEAWGMATPMRAGSSNSNNACYYYYCLAIDRFGKCSRFFFVFSPSVSLSSCRIIEKRKYQIPKYNFIKEPLCQTPSKHTYTAYINFREYVDYSHSLFRAEKKMRWKSVNFGCFSNFSSSLRKRYANTRDDLK